jgi:preprotein translocase subunit YajC
MMLISNAYAQAAGGAGGAGFDIVSILPLILIFVVFYFFLIRPQQKRVKEHRGMVEALKRGDRIVTAGGMLGEVTKVVNEREIEVEIAQGVKVKIVKQTVSEIVSKTEPQPAKSEKTIEKS